MKGIIVMKRKNRLLLLMTMLMVILASVGCGNSKPKKNQVFGGSIEGVWQSEGYGLVVELAAGKVSVYETTAISGIKKYEGTYSNNTIRIDDLQLNVGISNGKLVVQNDDLGVYYRARRIKELPQTCQNGGMKDALDPITNFEVFWHTFNEHYAFFRLRGVNWKSQYQLFRPRVNNNTSQEELLAIFAEMIRPLADPHVTINGLDEEIRFGIDEAVLMQGHALIRSQSDMIKVGRTGMLAYQHFSDDIGLVAMLGMFGYSDQSTVEAQDEAFDKVLNAFSDKRAIIIDLRYNVGGLDPVAKAVASRFIDQKRLAYSKQARNGNDYTPLQRHYIEPQGPQQFEGKVVLLTSRNTVSAGEIFVMMMKELPNVTMIGEATCGAHSDVLERRLPNGWQIGLSNERYYTAKGEICEKRGLKPDIEIPFNFGEIVRGNDRILKAAVEYVNNN
jgi:carboxyl-terminal processing protease